MSDHKPHRLAIVPVDPIGVRTAHGFACAPGRPVVTEWEERVYPKSPNGDLLREKRIEADLTLREAAALLGLTAVDYSRLESGRGTFTEQAAWEKALASIQSRPPNGKQP